MAQVMVAMSGGVDSSMAAALLVEQGHDVTGVHLKMADTPSGLPGKGCCTLDDARDARRVADRLGIPFYVWDFAEAFREGVVDDFVDSYAAGRTPNPCIRCNERVKYAALQRRAVGAGFDALATGHHVRLRADADGTVRLLRPVDPGKDQTYVLYMADQWQLQHSMFPAGEHAKAQLRQMAADRGLVTAAKPDSHDICFIPDGDTAGFLGARIPRRRGQIQTTDGTVVAEHDGAFAFTIGQRRGLGLAGMDKPHFVTSIEGDTVTVGTREQLAIAALQASDVGWTVDPPAAGEEGLTVQVRYHGTPHPARVRVAGDTMAVEFTSRTPEGVAPGQAAVVYRGDECLGGGTITATTATPAAGQHGVA